MTIEQQAQSLKEYGVLVLENVLSEDYVERCKNSIFDYFSNLDNISKGYRDSNQTIKSDGFNYVGLETCAEIVGNQEVIDVMREVTNGSVRWVHHSDVHINFSGAKQFHTDEQARLWPTETQNNISYKDKEYEVYRLATYLTEHTKEDGAPFFVKPKSHTSSYTGVSYSDAYEVDAKPGDVVIFHARLRHQGGNMKGDRAAMFWAFGDDNLHSKYHSMAAIKRQMNQNFQDEYILSKTLSDILDKHNVVYDIDKDELKHFMEISPNLDSY
jgi:ectoine hydroxylase-related dioxygenase (phytanoyl-CoA dioxygenase family)|tara:strand:- start:109 stop:918 length:810 start_codon:yes stop_codon:yes gene_type:complete